MSDQRRENLIVYGLLTAIVLAGVLWRLKDFTAFSLDQDEAFHALTLIRPDFLKVWFKECEHAFFFYVYAKLGVALFGPTLFGARIASLVFGAATIPIAFLIGCRAAGRTAGLWAAFFMALSFTPANWSRFLMGTVHWFFFPTLLIYLGLKLRERLSPWKFVLLLAVGLAAQYSAYHSLFVLGGIGLLFIYDAFKHPEERKRRLTYLAIYAAWLIVSGAVFIWMNTGRIERLPGSFYVLDAYSLAYLKNLGLAAGIKTFFTQLHGLLDMFLPFAKQTHVQAIFTGLTVFVAVVGVDSLRKTERGREFLILLAGAVLAQLIAMALSMWPILSRQSLYLSAFYYVFLGQGVVVIGRWLWEQRIYAALAFGILIILLLPLRAVLKEPYFNAYECGTSPFAEKLKENLRPGDAIYTDYHSAFSLAYLLFSGQPELVREAASATRRYHYSEYRAAGPPKDYPSFADLGIEPRRLLPVEIKGKQTRILMGGPDVSKILAAKPERVWVLVSFWADREEKKLFPEALEDEYVKVREQVFKSPGSKWMLFERKAGPD